MTINTTESILHFENLPFHVGMTQEPSNVGLPDILPFDAGVLNPIGLLVQVPNQIVAGYLEQAYRQGSMIGTPMADEGFGRRYADDFIDFYSRGMSKESLDRMRILEIGCGNGYLLHRLKGLGATTLGIEPGSRDCRYDVDILTGSFPDDRVLSSGPFDAIVHYGVLEHVTDPVDFLEAQVRCLSNSGHIVFSVPDSEEYIERGDVSMFLHEHWSYFSRRSLQALVEYVGLRLLRMEKSGFGGALYVVAGRNGSSLPDKWESDDLKQFEFKAKRGIEGTRRFLEDGFLHKISTGIFCPGRAINLLNIIQPENFPRFFDDDPNLHGLYYPPLPAPVESRQSLLTKPVDSLVIMSRSFGNKLRDQLKKEKVLAECRILLPDDILG